MAFQTVRARPMTDTYCSERDSPSLSQQDTDGNSVQAAYARLMELLDDPDLDVRRAAASSLGMWRDPFALDRLLDLPEDEPGDRSSPIAAAVTFIAIDLPASDKERVLGALWRFGLRGIPAARQIQDLTWRLGAGTDRGYPARVTTYGGSDAGQSE